MSHKRTPRGAHRNPIGNHPDYTRLEQVLNYTFQDRTLLQQALTHRSFVNESKQPVRSYERLEFLGDAVLEFVISEYLYRREEDLSEGRMTKLRASLVRQPSLAAIARELELGPELLLGKGENKRGERARDSLLSDSVEALLGAICIDGGLEAARSACFHLFETQLTALNVSQRSDYKNQLQELAAKRRLAPPSYDLQGTEGPKHDRVYTMQATLDTQSALGQGSSMKEASEQAAAQLLRLLQQPPAESQESASS